MEYQDAHYSGNFFWAHCDHVAALPRLWNRFDAWSVEYVPFNVSRYGSPVRNDMWLVAERAQSIV